MSETYVPLYSTHIARADYDGADLTIEFASGDRGTYRNVSRETFDGLKTARSAGEYHARQIRGRYAYEPE